MSNLQQNAEVEVCQLGRPLGDCSLKRVGCGSLYEVLRHVMPPASLLVDLRRRKGHLPIEVQSWLDRLDDIGAVRQTRQKGR
jgi:hypothetical protein